MKRKVKQEHNGENKYMYIMPVRSSKRLKGVKAEPFNYIGAGVDNLSNAQKQVTSVNRFK